MSNQLGNTAIAVLAGVVVGAGLGILFAPDEGKKTRKKIKKTFNESKDDLSDKIDELKKQVRQTVAKKKQDFETGFDEFLAHTEDKKDDVIAALEKKLAELKSKGNSIAENAKK
ncbi:YtxH domain-containing protein [Myroides odoratimimus]|uniref:YtxH domain-containing protein n=1 Tax=Myroides odoratimimus TaxID=76832 RepID=UPI001038B255|nr:YtxH domain-containing protein [Myroides odoratimimus]QBK75763.1 YtxH domain-containing protein [Myroides odoratimimus]